MPNQGPSYTSISDYLNANQGTLANEAAKVGGDVSSQLAAAQTADNAALSGTPAVAGDFTTTPGYADADQQQTAATQAAQNLGSPSGLATQLQSSYAGKSPDFNQDQANFDGQLLSASDPSSFAGIEKQGQTLSNYLQSGPAASSSSSSTQSGSGVVNGDSLPSGSSDPDGSEDTAGGNWRNSAPTQWTSSSSLSPRTNRNKIGGPY